MTDPFATYTTQEVAGLLRCCDTHVLRLVRRNAIPGRIKGVGRLIRFARPVVDAWLTCQRAG